MTAKALAALLLDNKITLEQLERFLASKKLTYIFPQILDELKQKKGELTRQNEVIIETPFELEKEALVAIRSIVGAGDEDRERIVENKALIMGFRAEYKGMLYDASAQRIIRELTK